MEGRGVEGIFETIKIVYCLFDQQRNINKIKATKGPLWFKHILFKLFNTYIDIKGLFLLLVPCMFFLQIARPVTVAW